MSNGPDVRDGLASRPDDGTVEPSNQVTDGQAQAEFGHAVQDGGGAALPLLAQPVSDAPQYRRSMFRR